MYIMAGTVLEAIVTFLQPSGIPLGSNAVIANRKKSELKSRKIEGRKKTELSQCFGTEKNQKETLLVKNTTYHERN